ncbi:MAG: hypothetical protein WC372_12555 [Candidatus Neomarinimicrobiota bacterium]|jgi:hypothetical protein
MPEQKHRAGCVIIQAIDTYVRVTVQFIGGPGAPDVVRVTKHQRPSAVEVARLVTAIRGYWPDDAVLQACGRGADDARQNWAENQLAL